MDTVNDRERKVLVCASCLRASCWHGEFFCEEYQSADVIEKSVAELDALRREHADHYSIKKIREVYGMRSGT